MTIRDCYKAIGGNYDDVIGRLKLDRLVKKFVLKFPADGSYGLLLSALAEGNAQEAFRAAHTIKGMCQNLGFTALEKSSSAITELLRAGDLSTAEDYLPSVSEDYNRTVEAIAQYEISASD